MIQELLAATGGLPAHVAAWLEEIPPAMRNRLVAWGIVDNRRWSANIGKSLSEHLDDYLAGLRADGRKQHHVNQTGSQIRRVLDGCNLRTWGEIDANAVKVFLARGRGPNGYGERTYNAHVAGFKAFCGWLKAERRVSGDNPLAGKDCGRVKQTEFRKRRRALTADEVSRLLGAAENGTRHHKMEPHARYLLWKLAIESGLRMGEVRSLTVASFDFAAEPPTVRVEAADSKGKRADDVILFPQTAEAIREHVRGKDGPEQAFHMPAAGHMVEALRQDLEAAGIPYTVNGRDADCHSLRHTFITNLCLAGVHPAVAQKLARHSSITLTMKYYTHVLRESEIDAMQKLAGLSPACQNGAQWRTLADSGGRKNGDSTPTTALSA